MRQNKQMDYLYSHLLIIHSVSHSVFLIIKLIVNRVTNESFQQRSKAICFSKHKQCLMQFTNNVVCEQYMNKTVYKQYNSRTMQFTDNAV